MTLRILLFIITTCMVHAVSASDISMRVGYAYDIKSSKLLYVESHFEIYQDNLLQSSRVVYTDVEDNIIAKKNLDFTHHLFMPEFSLSNLQTGHSETANIEQQRYQLAFSNSSLKTTDKARLNYRVTVSAMPVLITLSNNTGTNWKMERSLRNGFWCLN